MPKPACLTADPDDGPGADLYAAYNRAGPEATQGLNYAGKPCPQWHELPQTIRDKWDAVARRANHTLESV